MQIKKILVPVSGRYDPDDPENLDAPALETALHVASRHAAHVQVLSVSDEAAHTGRWTHWMPAQGINDLIDRIEREGAARRRRSRAAFDKAVADCEPRPTVSLKSIAGFSAHFEEQVGEIADTVGAYGRTSDLIVLASSKVHWASPFRPILEASLRLTGRPILVSPLLPVQSVGTRVAIAWNDSVESARAVAAGLDLICAAGHVVVLCCSESERVQPRPDRLLEYLACHGVAATTESFEASPKDAGIAIIDSALSHRCDLVLLGAFMHSRAHSLLFGSMTEYVLSDPRVPVLLVT